MGGSGTSIVAKVAVFEDSRLVPKLRSDNHLLSSTIFWRAAR